MSPMDVCCALKLRNGEVLAGGGKPPKLEGIWPLGL